MSATHEILPCPATNIMPFLVIRKATISIWETIFDISCARKNVMLSKTLKNSEGGACHMVCHMVRHMVSIVL